MESDDSEQEHCLSLLNDSRTSKMALNMFGIPENRNLAICFLPKFREHKSCET
jgi:hypothetical protein